SSLFRHPSHSDIYTLSLHDALPICGDADPQLGSKRSPVHPAPVGADPFLVDLATRSRWAKVEQITDPGEEKHDAGTKPPPFGGRSEEHTSELQSRENLVCRLLLEKK